MKEIYYDILEFKKEKKKQLMASNYESENFWNKLQLESIAL